MEQTKKTATYKITADSGGWAFRFFCDSSGELECVTGPIRADTEEAALDIAWETEGRHHFNRCDKCGRYVSAVMFNLAAGQCVDCAPWEDEYPTFCHHCGTRLRDPEGLFCSACGARLHTAGQTEGVSAP